MRFLQTSTSFSVCIAVLMTACTQQSNSNEEVLNELKTIKAELQTIKSAVAALKSDGLATASAKDSDAPAPTVAKSPAAPPTAASAPKTFTGKAGQTMKKVLLRKMSTGGRGGNVVSSHLLDLIMDPPLIESEGRKITVKYSFEVLDDMRAMFYCARTSKYYYQRMGQGWWLRLADGTRVEAKRAADRTAKRGKLSKPTKCVFVLKEGVDLALTKTMDMIYVPGGDMPGWPKDDMNRAQPLITVNLVP